MATFQKYRVHLHCRNMNLRIQLNDSDTLDDLRRRSIRLFGLPSTIEVTQTKLFHDSVVSPKSVKAPDDAQARQVFPPNSRILLVLSNDDNKTVAAATKELKRSSTTSKLEPLPACSTLGGTKRSLEDELNGASSTKRKNAMTNEEIYQCEKNFPTPSRPCSATSKSNDILRHPAPRQKARVRITRDLTPRLEDTMPSDVLEGSSSCSFHWMYMHPVAPAIARNSPKSNSELLHTSWTSLLQTSRSPTLNDVMRICVACNCLTGKWMMDLASFEEMDAVWDHIKFMMADGLCYAAKISGQPNIRGDLKYYKLLVYVRDFSDKEVVDRCLQSLRSLEILQRSPKRMDFKCDGMTDLAIYHGNKYGIRATSYTHHVEDGVGDEAVSRQHFKLD